MAWWNAILPVVTLALGWFGAELSDSRREARAVRRSRLERNESRAERARDQREEFERSTLHDLYHALSRMGRAAAVHHIADRNAAKEFGHLYAGAVLRDSTLGEELRQANVETGRLALLVLDDALRAQVDGAVNGLNAVGLVSSTVEEADARFQIAATDLMNAQRAVAARLRTLYKPAVAAT